MRCIILLISLMPWIALAQTPPRLKQISQGVMLPTSEIPQIVDLEGDGFKDIVFSYPHDLNPGRAAVIRNLGARSFATPAYSMYAEHQFASGDGFGSDDFGSDGIDADLSLVKLNGPTDYHWFFFKRSLHSSSLPFPPRAVRLDPLKTFGQRIILPSLSVENAQPIELDGDHRTEFFENTTKPGVQGEFRIWERQPAGHYLAQSFMVDQELDSDHAVALDLDGDADLDLFFPDDYEFIERTGHRAFSSTVREMDSFYQFTDLNGDGLPDAYKFEYKQMQWRLNLGNFLFGPLQSQEFDFPEVDSIDLLSIEERPSAPAVIYLAEGRNWQIALHALQYGTWSTISQSNVSLDELNDPNGERYFQGYLAHQDFDQDGHLDLVLSYFTTSSFTHSIYYRRLAIAWGVPSGPMLAEWMHPAPISYQTTLVKDFDRDGDIDLIHGPDSNGYHWFSPNSGKGSFPNPVRLDEITPQATADIAISILGIHTADLNGDRILDLVVDCLLRQQLYHRQSLGIAYGVGNGRFSPLTLPPGAMDFVASQVYRVNHLIDWDQDGDLDALGGGVWRENLGGVFSDETRILLGASNGSDALGNPVSILEMAHGDLDGDGSPEMLALNYRYEPPPLGSAPNTPGTYITGVLYNDGNGGIASIAELETNAFSSDIMGNIVLGRAAIVDMNLDGRNDIVIQDFGDMDNLGFTPQRFRWLRNPGGGSNNPASWVSLPLGSKIMPSDTLLDFNGDQQLEWVALNGYLRPTTRGPAISPMQPIARGIYFPPHFRSYPADFDGDGDADFLLTDSSDDATLVINPIVDERSAITYHLIAENVRPNRAGPTQDADADGRNNQMELINGTNPLMPDAEPINPLAVGLGDAFTYRTPHYANALKLNYQVQTSINLTDWVDHSPPPNPASQTSPGWNYFSLPVEKVEPSGYFRVKAWHALDE